jgi:hypothetical protein
MSRRSKERETEISEWLGDQSGEWSTAELAELLDEHDDTEGNEA